MVASLLLRSRRCAALGLPALVLVIAVLSALTVRQNLVFKDDVSLWEHAAAVDSRSEKTLTNLGWSYYYAGAFDKSLATFTQLRRLSPDDINLDLVLGYQRYQQKDWQGAISHLELAKAKQKESLDVIYLVAMSYKHLGDYPRAIVNFELMLQSNEQDYSGYRQNAQDQIALLRSLVPGNPAPSR